MTKDKLSPNDEWTRISSFDTTNVWVKVADTFLCVAGDAFDKPDVYRMVLLDMRQAEQLGEFVAKHFARKG